MKGVYLTQRTRRRKEKIIKGDLDSPLIIPTQVESMFFNSVAYWIPGLRCAEF